MAREQQKADNCWELTRWVKSGEQVSTLAFSNKWSNTLTVVNFSMGPLGIAATVISILLSGPLRLTVSGAANKAAGSVEDPSEALFFSQNANSYRLKLPGTATGWVGWMCASGSWLFSINIRSLANNVLASSSYYMLTIRLFEICNHGRAGEEEKVDRFSRIQNHLHTHTLFLQKDDPLSRKTTHRIYTTTLIDIIIILLYSREALDLINRFLSFVI